MKKFKCTRCHTDALMPAHRVVRALACPNCKCAMKAMDDVQTCRKCGSVFAAGLSACSKCKVERTTQRRDPQSKRKAIKKEDA
jgi:uncharacterized membrane protein YvbJ